MGGWRGKPDCKIFQQVTGLRVCDAAWDPEVARHEFYRDLAKMICWCHRQHLLSANLPLGDLVAQAIGIDIKDNYIHRFPKSKKAISWAQFYAAEQARVDKSPDL
jgi:hypothetical protein